MSPLSALPHDRLCAGIDSEIRLFAEALHDTDPATPSPTCPGWTADVLAGHLHQALGWAAGLVETRSPVFVAPGAASGPDDGDGPDGDWTEQVDGLAQALPGSPKDPDERTDWLLAGGARLTAALREAGPDAPVWTTFGPRESRFWGRWGALETAVHRADAELLAGAGTVRLDAALSLDSIDLWLTSLGSREAAAFFDPRLAQLAGSGQSLSFCADGQPDGWLVVRTPEGPVTRRTADGHADADMCVRAPAGELLLLLKRRIPVGSAGVSVTGDAALLDHWLEHALT